jgi:hypothetical protein
VRFLLTIVTMILVYSLLQRLNQIEVGAGISSTMLKVAPFVQLMGSPAPTDVAITITTSDWDLISSSLQGLKKIQACKIVEEIDLWKDVDGNKYSSPKAEKVFTEVRSRANAGC